MRRGSAGGAHLEEEFDPFAAALGGGGDDPFAVAGPVAGAAADDPFAVAGMCVHILALNLLALPV